MKVLKTSYKRLYDKFTETFLKRQKGRIKRFLLGFTKTFSDPNKGLKNIFKTFLFRNVLKTFLELFQKRFKKCF